MNPYNLLKFLLPALFCFTACKNEEMKLSDFTSDGCSLFIDGTFEDPDLWKECCLKHDIAYWQGGTEEEREAADIAFRECVKKKTGNSELAEVMYQAVRKGGDPYFPTWYRWGYGWPIGRGYKPLTNEEEILVHDKLETYYQTKNNSGI